MRHKNLIKMAALYATDDLFGSEKVFFETHLKSCEECAKTVEEIKELAGIVKPESHNEKIDLWSGVRAALYAPPLGGYRFENLKPRFSLPALATAVMIIVIMLIPGESKHSENGGDQTYSSANTIVRQSYSNGIPVVPHLIQTEDGTTIILFE